MTRGAHPELAVGAIVVHDGSLLLVRRGRGVAVGRWAPPGGHVEFGESLVAAVEREVHEESGIEVRAGELAGWVERTGTDPDPYHYVILDFYAAPIGATKLAAGDDAAEARWIPLAEVASLELVDGLFDFLVRIGSLPPVRTQGPAEGEETRIMTTRDETR